MDHVPVIDLQTLDQGDALAQLDRACRDHGFFLLLGHGAEEAVDAMWQQAQALFARPRRELLAMERTADWPMGYYDKELTKRKRDLKQVFDFARPFSGADREHCWPAEWPEFRRSMSDYFEAMSTLAVEVMSLLHRALGVADGALSGDPDSSNVRLNYYPTRDPLSADEQTGATPLGDMALHHHTDPGLVTLLAQDDTGGLQTRSGLHGWIDVPPRQGTIIVNLGDSVQAWSNDTYRAALHRVCPMTDRARLSTPYFYHPAADAVIAPHPDIAGDAPRYQPFRWREFIQSRVDDNFTDLGAADTQVTKYRINRT